MTSNKMIVKDEKFPEYTEKQQKFLVALAGEAKGEVRTAMNIAGYSKNTKLGEVVNPLREAIKEIAEHILAVSSVKAALAYGDVIDTPSQFGANHKIAAASQILDRIGVTKKEEKTPNIQAGTVYILPPKDST